MFDTEVNTSKTHIKYKMPRICPDTDPYILPNTSPHMVPSTSPKIDPKTFPLTYPPGPTPLRIPPIMLPFNLP